MSWLTLSFSYPSGPDARLHPSLAFNFFVPSLFLPSFPPVPRYSHLLFYRYYSVLFSSSPFFLYAPLSCQETFDQLSLSFFLPSPNIHFLRSYLGTFSHLPPPLTYSFSLSLPLSFSTISSLYHCLPIGIRTSSSIASRGIVSVTLALRRSLLPQRGLILLSLLSRRLTPLAFPLRHLPRAILPPSARLAHPAVVSLRYSPFCPRGTSNAEAQVCKMAAVHWGPTRRGRCFAWT